MGSLEQAVYAIIISFVIGVILCPIVIPMLRKLKFGQNVRDDGPQTHLAKQGTPTMGGVAFLAAFVITSLFFLKGNRDGAAIMLMTLCYGLIGFLDDYIKVVKKRSLGLRAYQKLLLQLIVTGLFCSYIMKSGIGTAIYIPFTDGKMIDLQLIFIPFLFVAVLGTVNGVNLTDGLDGLAGGVTLLVAAFFMIVAWAAGSTIAPVCGAIVGGLMAFLIFNSYPAKVGWFKLTKRKYGEGRRLFKMAPFHHHLEKCGWKETKVVTLFYVATALLCLIGFLGCKYMFL